MFLLTRALVLAQTAGAQAIEVEHLLAASKMLGHEPSPVVPPIEFMPIAKSEMPLSEAAKAVLLSLSSKTDVSISEIQQALRASSGEG